MISLECDGIQIKAGWMEPSLCIRQHSEWLYFKVRLNELVLKESDQQLTTGGINSSAENDANLPPSVAKEGGQKHYQKINESTVFHVCGQLKKYGYRSRSLLLVILYDRFW